MPTDDPRTRDGRAAAAPRLPGLMIVPRPLRRHLQRQVLALLSRSAPAADYDAPVGDAGLFGPDSVTWKVHADFPSMMAGGLAALMLQSLHPLALAGVWDHSAFRTDTLGRLRNTTAFVSRTTYAPRATAEAAIDRVLDIHHRVRGVAADGRPYSADDPHLLTWVHCAECWSFLQAYQTYCQAGIPLAQQDRYLAEMARIAEALGAREVPTSRAELEAFFTAARPELVYDHRVREVLGVLRTMPLPIAAAGPRRQVFIGAAAVLLPDWALDLMGRTPLQRLGDRAAARALRLVAPSIRGAVAEGGLAWRACRRTGADFEGLFRWD